MKKNKLILASLFMTFLIVMLPVTFATELKLVYDNNGNLLTGDGKYRVYNSLNQLSKIYNGTNTSGTLLQEYTYHPIEERILIKVTYDNGTNETTYYVDENFVRVVNSSGSYDFTYVKHEGQLVAQVNADGSKYYIHGDHLGSSTIVTDESGAVIENSSYSPFGEIVEGGEASRYGYEGKEFDSVVGDTDFHFRKYKAEWGIFLQPDSLLPNVYDPQQLNRYSFERNNPYKYTDPTGHEPVTLTAIALGLVAAAAAGAAIGASVSAGIEIFAQVRVTGGIYSWDRIGSSAASGAYVGAVVGLVAFIPGFREAGVALGINMGAGVVGAYDAFDEAKKYQASKNPSTQDDPQCELNYCPAGETISVADDLDQASTINVNPPAQYNQIPSSTSSSTTGSTVALPGGTGSNLQGGVTYTWNGGSSWVRCSTTCSVSD